MRSASSFFTPPVVPPVSLELADLGGGGACPTQFYGNTTDGREVYVRYRGGGLTIHVGNAPGRDPLKEGTCILDVRLGPVLDGVISLRQFLRLTGLSVPYTLAEDEAEDEENDLSGATSFWRAVSLPTTEAGAQAVVDTLRDVSGQVTEVFWADGKTTRRSLSAGQRPTSNRLEFALAGTVIHLHYSRFRYDFPGYGMPNGDSELSAQIGTEVSISGSRESDLKFDNLSLSADFATGDAAARAALERIGAEIDRHYPVAEYCAVDPLTAQPVDVAPLRQREDPRIADWIAAEAGRYRYVRRERGIEGYAGYRPV